MSFSTGFKSPTAARSLAWDGGSGDVTNVGDILTGGYGIFNLPDGATFTPSSAETDIGHLLPIQIFQNGYDFSSLPANAIVKGITVHTKLYSENPGNDDPSNVFFNQFTCFPDYVPMANNSYNWLEPKDINAPLNDASQQTLGGSTDVWQPNPNLTIDGMFIYATDGLVHGYEVITSTLAPSAYDFSYSNPNLTIQPTTRGYETAAMDASGQPLDYTGLVGKTITLTIPGVGDFTLTGQLLPVVIGDATFQAAVDNSTTVASITNQFLSYSNVNGAVADYLSITYFQDIVWEWTPNDTGAGTNLYRLTTNANPSALLWPNDGYFSGGEDPDPNASTMANDTGANLINTVSGAPMYAQVIPNVPDGLEVTNTITNFSLKHSVAASVFKNPKFGVSSFFNWTTQGDPLNYPELADNNAKQGITTISLTYILGSSGLLTMGCG